MPNPKEIAIFDLDGTLTPKDTFIEFIKFSKGKRKYYWGLLILSPFIIAYYLKFFPNHRLKEKFFGYFFSTESATELKKKGDSFSQNILPGLIFKEALQIIQWHKNKKHHLVLLTASSSVWLEKWCQQNGMQFIGTEFEIKNDFYTGKIKGKNCYGIRKAEIIQELLVSGEYKYSFGYGDSSSDKHFLDLVDIAHLMPLNEKNGAIILEKIQTKSVDSND